MILLILNDLGKKSDEVADWLREIGLEAYIDRFLSNGYDNLNVSKYKYIFITV